MPPIRAAHFISSFWFEILPVIHLTMVKADLDHPALEKVPFYEARLIHRKDIHTASDHSAGLFLRYYKQQHWHLHHGYSWQTANSGGPTAKFLIARSALLLSMLGVCETPQTA